MAAMVWCIRPSPTVAGPCMDAAWLIKFGDAMGGTVLPHSITLRVNNFEGYVGVYFILRCTCGCSPIFSNMSFFHAEAPPRRLPSIRELSEVDQDVAALERET